MTYASQAAIGYLTLLERGDANGANFVEVAEVRSLSSPEETADDIEVTHMQSPGRRKEYIQGFVDTGECQFQVNYNSDAYPIHSQILADQAAGTRTYWRFTLPADLGSEVWTFLAYVKSAKLNPEPGSVVTLDVTLKQAAAVVIT
jgi:hypothetical protein